MRILVIEDDQKVAGFIRKGLTEEHYAVDVVHDGEDGVFWGAENEYDLILLDIMLPKKDGRSVCRELCAKGIVTPIMMLLTAKDTIADKVKRPMSALMIIWQNRLPLMNSWQESGLAAAIPGI